MNSSEPFDFTIKIDGDEFTLKIDGDRKLSVRNNSQNYYKISFKNPQGAHSTTLQPEGGFASNDLANPANRDGYEISVNNLGCEDPGKT